LTSNIKLFLQNTNRIDYINYLILLYAFLLPLSLDGLRAIAIVLLIFWISDKDIFTTSIPKVLKIFLIFIAFSFISYIWSDATFQEVFKYIKRYWYFFPSFLIFKYIKQEYIKYSISAFLLGMLISEIVSYSVFFQFIPPLGHATISDPSPFMQHTMYSVFLATTSIFLLGRFLYEEEIKYKLIYLIFFLSVSVNLFIGSGRTGQIAFFGALVVLFIYKYKLTIKTIFLSLISIVFIFYTAYNLSPNFKNRMHHIQNDVNGMISKNNYRSSIGIRIGFWIITKEMFLENPILGVGTANHLNMMKETVDKELQYLHGNKRFVHFHNQYWEILAQLGIVGLFLFLFFIYSIIKIKIIDHEIELLKIGLISTFILGLFADNLLWLNMSIMLFSFIVGILLAQNKYETNI
jgi:O-antigen ligase